MLLYTYFKNNLYTKILSYYIINGLLTKLKQYSYDTIINDIKIRDANFSKIYYFLKSFLSYFYERM